MKKQTQVKCHNTTCAAPGTWKCRICERPCCASHCKNKGSVKFGFFSNLADCGAHHKPLAMRTANAAAPADHIKSVVKPVFKDVRAAWEIDHATHAREFDPRFGSSY